MILYMYLLEVWIPLFVDYVHLPILLTEDKVTKGCTGSAVMDLFLCKGKLPWNESVECCVEQIYFP